MDELSTIKTTIGNNEESDKNDIIKTRENFKKIGIDIISDKKAKIGGDLAGGLVTRWTNRIPTNNKAGKILKKGNKVAENFISSGIAKLLKNHFMKAEKEKRRQQNIKKKN